MSYSTTFSVWPILIHKNCNFSSSLVLPKISTLSLFFILFCSSQYMLFLLTFYFYLTSSFFFLGFLFSMALPLNPKAPEFYPKSRAQEPNYPSHSTFSVKPGKLRQPKCLPPRLLKQKVWVHKNRNFLPRKPLPPPKESELKSLPSPQEDTFKSLFGDKTSVMIRNIPNIFGSVFNFQILFCNVYLC